jgi:GntR family transcriptional repressor for pyruvate dehydrogenase complex
MAKETGKTPGYERFVKELTPVSREGLTDYLVRKLKALILRGGLTPGEKLPPERDLATMLNVSRTTMRQAIKILEVIGVLDVRPGSGTYLSTSAQQILEQPTYELSPLPPLRGLSQGELFEARRAIEAEASAAAAVRAETSDISRIEEALAQMSLHLNDPHAYAKYDMAFHQAITAASGNSFFIWFEQLTLKALYDAWLARTSSKERRIQDTFHEHERIARAIKLRDPEGARMEMLRHLVLSRYYSDEQSQVEIHAIADSQ